MLTRRDQGAYGERLARAYLERQGFVFYAKNVRTPFGELDLIMRDGNCLVFCEVKYRRSGSYGRPEAAITRTKLRHLSNAIAYRLLTHPWHGPYRLDVLALTRRQDRVVIRHFRHCGGAWS